HHADPALAQASHRYQSSAPWSADTASWGSSSARRPPPTRAAESAPLASSDERSLVPAKCRDAAIVCQAGSNSRPSRGPPRITTSTARPSVLADRYARDGNPEPATISLAPDEDARSTIHVRGPSRLTGPLRH